MLSPVKFTFFALKDVSELPANAFPPNVTSSVLNVTLSKLVLEKAARPTLLTFSRLIFFNVLSPENAWVPISVTVDGSTTSSSEV